MCEAIEEVDFSKNLRLYPNPSPGFLYITLENETRFDIKVLNMLCEEVLSLKDVKNNTELDLSKEAQGLYTIFVSTQQQVAVKKIMLTK